MRVCANGGLADAEIIGKSAKINFQNILKV